MTGPYHTTILHNTATGRFHPMPFRPAPRPSDELLPGAYCRHRSIGHHTEGFESLDLAVAHIDESESFWPTGLLFRWDGQGMPNASLELPYFQKMEGEITWALPEEEKTA